MSTRADRIELIRALEEARGGTHLIAYLTSTRPNLESQMAMDAIPMVHRHLQSIDTPKDETKIDLLLHSNGGEGTVPWRLVTLIREYCSEFNVLVPHHAFSAATLTAMGADHVLVHRMGMLGPIDPTANHPMNPANPQAPGQTIGISVEDVSSYISLVKEDVGIRHEDELVQAFAILAQEINPLALGHVKRATSQSRMMGEKLLRQRPNQQMGEHDLAELIEKLTSQLYYHGHPINRNEARDDLRMTFVEDAPPEIEDHMWSLYTAYADDMQLGLLFDPIQNVHAATGGIPLGAPGAPPAVVQADVGPFNVAYVESVARTDVSRVAFQATIFREFNGNTGVSLLRTQAGWEEET